MAELDKKIQKVQTDLVQSVLEAQEKRNLERVDMLVINAIKQLKMSRFKPDLTTCLSLIYLARISPKLFLQSSAIKENLKSLLRRDSGPANIKGKNDIVLPILAANILLACCGDSPEINTIILNKIEQWLSGNQKVSDLVQHLLATLCMKCQPDKQTITTLIEMRQHWLQYLDDNHAHYGSVPVSLSANIRQLLHTESNCESLITYLKFLIKHDIDTEGLATEVSKFIIERPISLKSMLNQEEVGVQLYKMMLKIFIKLFVHLKNVATQADSTKVEPKPPDSESSTNSSKTPLINHSQATTLDSKATGIAGTKIEQTTTGITVKLEPKDSAEDTKSSIINGGSKDGIKNEVPISKDESKSNLKATTEDLSGKIEPIKKGPVLSRSGSSDEDTTNSEKVFIRSLYVKLPNCSKVIALSRLTIEAVLTLLALAELDNNECKEEFKELLECWLNEGEVNQIATIYEDYGMSSLYDLPDQLRLKLSQSSNDLLVELGLQGASTGQLIKLLQSFGSPVTTINKILKRLEQVKDIELIKSVIRDTSYFNQMIEFYSKMGALGARDLYKRLEQTTL